MFDNPGSYIHTETEKYMIMLVGGSLSNILVKVAPKIYRKYIIVSSKGKPLLYIPNKKALYGLVNSALILYRNLVKYLEEYIYQINPYYSFVENNMINDKYMALLWHVENLKVTHVYRLKTTKFSGYLSRIYGRLTVHRVNVHDYLVMYLDYTEQVAVKFSMIKYLDSVLQGSPGHLGAT